MYKKLSIIMPCYNCESTIEEAVNSIYKQDLQIPFEVVMVNDGSTDNTEKIINNLVIRFSEIKRIIHKQNRGGGATRNTAVKNSDGDLIFCLDSDDILPKNMLYKMVECISKKKVDGVVFHEARFFKGLNKNKTSSSFNNINNRNFEVKDLFNENNGSLTLVNFLYTKKAFDIAGGYPENHNMDTQAFGFRFITKGLKACVCPDTYYFHRQANKKSYFERMYESGEFSLNFYYIYEEILYLFSREDVKNIIKYNVFKNSKLGEKNLKVELDLKYLKKKDSLFISNYKNYVIKDGFDKYIKETPECEEFYNKFIRAVYFYKKHEFNKALDLFIESLNFDTFNKLVYFNIIRCVVALSGVNRNLIEKESVKITELLALKKQKINLNPNFIKKILIFLWKFVKKYKKVFNNRIK
ncbi:MAG: glycosyltransferase [Candidatus Magasanikbacteria bacterium]|nr:glycosyltransferase [Candidatus Magasanikbacteria bacterium]